MNCDNSLRNNASYSNNLQSSQSFQMEQPSLNTLYNTSNYNDYSSATDNDNVPASYTEQQHTFSFVGDEHATTRIAQPLPHAPQYAPQYNSYSYPSLNSINMIPNSSEVFRFEIPGFKIIIIPNSSPYSSLYTNLDNLDQPRQVFTPPNIVIDNSQTQLQQNSNESFINFNNFHG
ncbi:hypothetical protein RclHR1_02610030 [Rhizophagus clarus]|uniref:Uncharacterized protein n=1 Tax=Rhizophagus clarus TaxID=94130 RepID=A0A2Z6R045_9GLOM|nr:hypothetical protein RclHR1_02610030 [Rhizophagus clarus]GES81186.1 hypothetical protein GLOIN_2v1675424 [Rhizophagus clarus]